jgi:hypothetical protein
MSGEPAEIDPALLVFRDIRLRGFWLTRHLASVPHRDLVSLYGGLEDLMRQGLLRTIIDSGGVPEVCLSCELR